MKPSPVPIDRKFIKEAVEEYLRKGGKITYAGKYQRAYENESDMYAWRPKNGKRVKPKLIDGKETG